MRDKNMRGIELNNPGEFDLLLDAALSTYGDPAPGDGLEERVLAAISAECGKASAPSLRRRSWVPWAVALPLAAALVLIWLSPHRSAHPLPNEPTQARRADQASGAPQAVKATLPEARDARAAKHRAHAKLSQPAQVAATTVLPKLDVFPAPQPLSAEERELALVANQAPMPLRKALIEAQNDDDLSPHFAVMHLPPLQSPDEGQN